MISSSKKEKKKATYFTDIATTPKKKNLEERTIHAIRTRNARLKLW